MSVRARNPGLLPAHQCTRILLATGRGYVGRFASSLQNVILLMMTLAFRTPAVQLALSMCLGCGSFAAPVGPSQTPGEVRLVEQAEFDAMRESGQFVFSEPLGEVTAAEACTSGSVDEQCVNAARERIRKEASERGANLVLVRAASSLQSYPPRYVLDGVLYVVRQRR